LRFLEEIRSIGPERRKSEQKPRSMVQMQTVDGLYREFLRRQPINRNDHSQDRRPTDGKPNDVIL
jgi:hypothetical protein